MALGESGTGADLTLTYDDMCNGPCKCNNRLGYCLESKRKQYRLDRCNNACNEWFGDDFSKKQSCIDVCQWGQKPVSRSEFLSRYPDGCNDLRKFYLAGDTSWINNNCFWSNSAQKNVDITKIYCNKVLQEFPEASQDQLVYLMSKCIVPGGSGDPNAPSGSSNTKKNIEKSAQDLNKWIVIITVIIIVIILAIYFYAYLQ
jgi:hypothetical protein